MPEELVGVWRTSTPPYADRYMELTPQQVKFGSDIEGGTAHLVDEVREVSTSKNREFEIQYLSAEGLEYHLSLNYSSSDQIVRLKNQPQMAWRRTTVYD